MKRIEDINELKEICSGETVDCFIQLCAGARSSKCISYDDDTDTWYILHEIDDSEQVCTTEELGEETNILEALDKRALYRY